jgi:hypothetical protein
MIVLDILKSFFDAFRGYPATKVEWHGAYLDEDGIVADILSKVKNDPIARKRWLDPKSWYLRDKFDIADGIITDPRHVDNLFGRVIDRVKAELAKDEIDVSE